MREVYPAIEKGAWICIRVRQWLDGPVDDPATTFLMTRFYEHLVAPDGVQKMPMVDALRRAMLEAKKLHPETYYWAPFSLIGDWR